MDEDVLAILRSYPQIYLACHVEHRIRSSSPTGLTSHDSSILAHLADDEGISAARLAQHLGVARSTLSAALARLEGLGLVAVTPDPSDGRRRSLRLTEAGRASIAENSVLDPARLEALLARLSPEERCRAVEGLRLLATAARMMREEGSGPCGSG
jgi:DNA-binding MarR family transcriptional regulator